MYDFASEGVNFFSLKLVAKCLTCVTFSPKQVKLLLCPHSPHSSVCCVHNYIKEIHSTNMNSWKVLCTGVNNETRKALNDL